MEGGNFLFTHRLNLITANELVYHTFWSYKRENYALYNSCPIYNTIASFLNVHQSFSIVQPKSSTKAKHG